MKKYSALTMTSLFLALVGIAFPIVWDLFKGRRSLDFELESTLSLIENDPIMNQVEISFGGKPIANISRYRFWATNGGTSPIVDDEVKVFPTIDFGADSTIVTSRIVSKKPSDLSATLETDVHSAVLRFDLLNPGDRIAFDVYLSGLAEENPRIRGRIKGIPGIALLIPEPKHDSTKSGLSWTHWVAGVVGSILLLLSLPHASKEVRQQIKLKRKIAESKDYLMQYQTKDALVHFVEKEIKFPTTRDQKKLLDLVLRLPENSLEASEQFEHAREDIIEVVQNDSAAVGAMVVLFVVFGCGIAYFLWGFFS